MNFSMFKAKGLLTFASFLVWALLAGSVFAQSGTSGVSGIVVDQAGSAVPGATVRLSNPETGLTRSVTTDESGRYSFPSISPATYQIEVEAAGFKKLLNTNVQARVNTPSEMTLTLEPGSISAIVNVTSGSIESLINTQDASLGTTVGTQQITQLP